MGAKKFILNGLILIFIKYNLRISLLRCFNSRPFYSTTDIQLNLISSKLFKFIKFYQKKHGMYFIEIFVGLTWKHFEEFSTGILFLLKFGKDFAIVIDF